MLPQKCAEQIGIDVSLDDWRTVQCHTRRSDFPREIGTRITECFSVERAVLAECKRQRQRLTTTARSANALSIRGNRRRYIRHHHRLDGPNIDTHFHSGGAAQNIDSAFFEGFLVSSKGLRVLLRGMLSRTSVISKERDTIIKIPPSAALSQDCHSFIGREPSANRLAPRLVIGTYNRRSRMAGQFDTLCGFGRPTGAAKTIGRDTKSDAIQ